MPNLNKKPTAPKHTAAGRRLLRSVKQATAWANGEDVRVRVTMVSVERQPVTDVRSVRRRLGLSQLRAIRLNSRDRKELGAGRTQPDGPARILLAVIAHHPEVVEDALRKAS